MREAAFPGGTTTTDVVGKDPVPVGSGTTAMVDVDPMGVSTGLDGVPVIVGVAEGVPDEERGVEVSVELDEGLTGIKVSELALS